jgi:4-amino-4-deoxy-L-arabinose transferase-like glycosyltransferase
MVNTLRPSSGPPETPDSTESRQAVWPDVTFSIILFFTAFLPRAVYLVARSSLWHIRTRQFVEALSQGDWAATLLAPHPGVTTVWLAGMGRQLAYLLMPSFDQLGTNQQMSIELLPMVLVISLAVVLAYLILIRLFDRRVAAVSSLFLALDPFHISISKTLHVDALMSVFAMLSALTMLMVVRQGGRKRWRYILLSGFMAGLALLSKSPAVFLVPFQFLCLAVWQLNESLERGQRLSGWRDWLKPVSRVLSTALPWLLVLVLTYVVLWPSMWVQPGAALNRSLSRSMDHIQNPHPNDTFFMGEITSEDPGVLYYPVNLALKTTEVTLPCFFLGAGFIFHRRLERRQRLVLMLMIAFVFFFTLQMTLGEKKFARYNLPPYQFVDMVAGCGVVWGLEIVTRRRRWLLNMGLAAVVLAQFVLSISRHPYYGTHYNRILGSPKAVLEKGIVAGQEQAEGLDIAARYLNSLPLSPLLVVGTHTELEFNRYFGGTTVRMTSDQMDYLVFARNYVLRGLGAYQWQALWEQYQTRHPKLVVSFDDVPYVWVYKVGPVIDVQSIENRVLVQVGQDIRLLGYELEPAELRPGDSVQLVLYWEAIHKSAADYTVFVHLLDPSGDLHAQNDSQPQNGMYPTYLWDEGERIRDVYQLTISPDALPGAYQIAVGMYELSTLQRLPLTDSLGSPLPDARLLISGIDVLPPQE